VLTTGLVSGFSALVLSLILRGRFWVKSTSVAIFQFATWYVQGTINA